MRITFLTHFPGRGGSTALVCQLLRHFKSRGYDTVTVVGADSADPLLSDYKVFRPTPGADWRQRLSEYRDLVVSTRPDVVYFVSGFEEADLLRFLPYVRLRHIFTLEQHDWVDVPYWLGQLGAYWEACTANTPDVIDAARIYAPHDYAGLFTPYWLEPIFYGLDDAKVQRPAGSPVEICCTGRIEEYQKRIHWIPEIVKQCRSAGRNFVWHIYGAGPAEESFRQGLRRHGCEDIVRMHGWLESEALAARAMKHDIYFSCSRYEGLPVAMLEAMFCGLACVVPVLPGGIRYVIDQGGVSGYAADSPASGAKALLAFTNDISGLPARKTATRRVAHQLFGLDVLQKQYSVLEESAIRLKFNGRVLDVHSAPKIRQVRWPTLLKRQFTQKIWKRLMQRSH